MNDIEHVTTRLRALIGEQQHPDRLVAFVHGGPPISKARARWAKNGKFTYTPKRTTHAQRDLAEHFQSVCSPSEPFLENVALVAIFYRQNLQRIDGDNLMKLVMDAATEAGIWQDDCQVTAHAALVEYDPVAPRTVVALCPYVSSLVRGPEVMLCAYCEQPFERPRWYANRKAAKNRPPYCSTACAQATKHAPVRCAKCEKGFERAHAGQRYCSSRCAAADPLVRQPAGKQRPWPKCESCGERVSRREYTQCAKCRGLGRPKAVKPLQQPALFEAPKPQRPNPGF